jgi:hypothetical protein
MKTIDEANAELVRHRNLALTDYANRLLADGADIDGDEFRVRMLEYASTVEKWRCDSIDHIRQVIKAAAERHSATIN